MICLALDPGKVTGWAVPDASGTLRLEHPGDHRLPQPLRHGTWFGRARILVDQLIDVHQVEAIALERQPIIRGQGSLVTLGLRGVVLEIAWSRRLLVDEAPPSLWQAWARGHGWSKVASRSGGDEVDAVALLQWWLAVQLPKVRVA